MPQFLKLSVAVIVLMLTIACGQPLALNNTNTPTPSTGFTGATSTPVALSDEVVQRLKTKMAQQLGLEAEQIRLKNSRLVEWGDACLGLSQPDELCAQVVTPGYQVLLTTPQGDYQVHSDRTGQVIRVADQP